MSRLQAPKGCPDIFPDEIYHRQQVLAVVRKCVQQYGFLEHETPIFEHAEVFLKSLGDDTDVVTKEMYTFTDKGGDLMVLRPEATASIARLFVSHKLFRELPYKVFYQGPMFRHERPQKGRLRQFTQLGVECLGQRDPIVDAEIIALGWRIVKDLNLHTHAQILLNSLGQAPERKKFKDDLVKFLTSKKTQLSEDSQNRLSTNPLRILDSKDENDQKLLIGGPELKQYLSSESLAYIAEVETHLKALEIPYTYESKLVRGLDYYNDTVFEIQHSELGAQGTLLAGGRYDHLISSMGGPDCPSFGWAAGLERLLLLTQFQRPQVTSLGIVDMNHEYRTYLLQVAEVLRHQGHSVNYSLTGNFSKQMKKCEKNGSTHVVIFGPDEVTHKQVQLKHLASGQQKALSWDELLKITTYL
ncbi:MAG: histidine--tRNA ligase [Bdellovibrionaceae bacterium]|nr:histidine--tRNA ligase [Pseudobdellovibrionaceae bacterium]